MDVRLSVLNAVVVACVSFRGVRENVGNMEDKRGLGFWRRFGLRQQAFQPAERFVPLPRYPGEVCRAVLQSLALDREMRFPASPLASDNPGSLQGRQVLGHALSRQANATGKLDDGMCSPIAQALYQGKAGRVAERGKDSSGAGHRIIVQMMRHALRYSRPAYSILRCSPA